MQKIILLAIETLGGGGAERVVLDIMRHWPKESKARPILLVTQRMGEYNEHLPPDFPIIEVGVPSSPRKSHLFLSRLRRKLADYDVKGVISHMTGMNRMLLRARLIGLLQAPIMVVEHNNFARDCTPSMRLQLVMREIRFLYRRADAVVGCSQGVAEKTGSLFRIAPEKTHYIVNPVNELFYQPTPLSPEVAEWFNRLPRPVLISVARMAAQKGQDILIKAFAQLKRGSLIIVGEGPLRKELESLAESLGVADRIAMPGFLHHPQALLQAADLYVSTSHWEGYPVSLIEAYASGLPIVACDCDFGVREIVTPDRPGELVTSHDPAKVAEAIERCLNDKAILESVRVDLPENQGEYVSRKYYELLKSTGADI